MNYYFLLPNVYKPKYLLGINSKRIFSMGLMFYLPLSSKAKLKKRSLEMIYPFIRSFLRRNIISEQDLLRRFGLKAVKEILDSKRSSTSFWNIYLPSRDKLIIQVLNGCKMHSYIKIGLTQKGNDFICREKDNLDFLLSYNFHQFEIPNILYSSQVEDKNILMLTSPPRFSLVTGSQPSKEILSILIELFYLNQGSKMQLKESTHYREIKRRVKGSKYFTELEETLSLIENKFGKQIVTTGFAHYDFKPWNMLRNQASSKIFLIDWEFMRKDSLPLWDAFSYIIQPLLLGKYYKKGPKKILNELDKHNRFFKNYLKELNLDPGLHQILFPLYLIDMILFFDKYGINDDRTRYSIDTMWKILKCHAIKEKY